MEARAPIVDVLWRLREADDFLVIYCIAWPRGYLPQNRLRVPVFPGDSKELPQPGLRERVDLILQHIQSP